MFDERETPVFSGAGSTTAALRTFSSCVDAPGRLPLPARPHAKAL